MSYIVEVNGAGDPPDVWSGNGLTFEAVQEAVSYGVNLLCRWSGARDFRVRQAASPQDEGPVVWPEENDA